LGCAIIIKMKKFSVSFPRGLFWSRKLSRLDLIEDRCYIIHQLLAYGDLDQIRQLFQLYPKSEIKKVFIHQPRKIYTPSSFNFVKNFLLGLRKKKLDRRNYVKNLS